MKIKNDFLSFTGVLQAFTFLCLLQIEAIRCYPKIDHLPRKTKLSDMLETHGVRQHTLTKPSLKHKERSNHFLPLKAPFGVTRFQLLFFFL